MNKWLFFILFLTFASWGASIGFLMAFNPDKYVDLYDRWMEIIKADFRLNRQDYKEWDSRGAGFLILAFCVYMIYEVVSKAILALKG